VRDVAEQARLSEATVDRVLHGRPGASARAVRAVEQALLELDRQQTQLRLGVRSLMLDVVMQAPRRFSTAVREALEDELVAARPAAVRARFHLRESGGAADLATQLDDLGRRGRTTQGVLLKAPDHPDVAGAVARLHDRGIPVVTLVTDVRDCPRVAYVGLDNTAAGETAAYLIWQWLRHGGDTGAVLLTLSRSEFFGEWERAAAFRASLARHAPALQVVEVSDADGLDAAMGALVRAALERHEDVRAVYSVGGGNRATASELARAGARCEVFLGHDLDADNLALLGDGVLSAVLHHDLRADMRAAIRQVLRHHRLLPGAPTSVRAGVQVVTPYNIPARLAPV
jgi:LacI family transcriptional regulator